MGYNCAFEVGQLVEYRAWYDGEGSWISIENQIGIVLEIITIADSRIEHMDESFVVYDVKVYWVTDGVVEIVPDMLLVEYGDASVQII